MDKPVYRTSSPFRSAAQRLYLEVFFFDGCRLDVSGKAKAVSQSQKIAANVFPSAEAIFRDNEPLIAGTKLVRERKRCQ